MSLILIHPFQDSTLIQTSSGKKFASDAQDWKWWHSSVPNALRRLYTEEGYAALTGEQGMKLTPMQL